MSDVMQRTDRWIPWYFVAFFTVVALVDAVMVTLAVTTQPGLVTQHAYEKGLAYNDTVSAARTQDALGWKGVLSSRAESHKTIFSFQLKDGEGQPVISQHVTLNLTRPVQDGLDLTLPMRMEKDGEYLAEAILPARGVWQMRVFVHDRDIPYQQSRRIVIE